jgi:hypothetical protein
MDTYSMCNRDMCNRDALPLSPQNNTEPNECNVVPFGMGRSGGSRAAKQDRSFEAVLFADHSFKPATGVQRC